MTNRHAVVTRAAAIASELLVDTADEFIFDRGTDQRRGDRLRHRHGDPARAGVDAMVVVLECNPPALQQQQANDTVTREIVGKIDAEPLRAHHQVLKLNIRPPQFLNAPP